MTRTLKTAFTAAILAASTTFAVADNSNFIEKAELFAVARMSTGLIEGRNSADVNAFGQATSGTGQSALIEGRNTLILPEERVVGHDPAGSNR